MKSLGNVALAALGMATVWVGCTPAAFEGEIGSEALGGMGTAFFDASDDESGVNYLFFASPGWSCEELQVAVANDTYPAMSDPDEVYTIATFLMYEYSSESPIDYTAKTGDYTVVDGYADALNLTEGSLYTIATFGYRNNSETTEAYYGAENGSLTITKVDLTSSISGEFQLSLSTADIIEGSFTAKRCDLSD